MLALNFGEKKTKTYLAALVIFAIVSFAAYYFFFRADDQAALGAKNAAGKSSVAVKKLEIKKINLDILNDDSFTKLKDYQALNKNIKSFEPGNKNPFVSGD